VTEHRQQTTSLPMYDSALQGKVHSLQMVIMFVSFIVYNERTAVTEKCVVVYRTAWI